MSLLLALALVPAIVLCIYVFIKDRVEKEPVGLLIKLFVFGALICFPAAYIEDFLFAIIDLFFYEETYLYILVQQFFGVGLVEEGLKFIVLLYITKNNQEFNCLFDGLIYAIFVSLGFAALENVFYVFANGIEVGIMRAFLSVPGHMFFAVLMGYYYSIWHITDKASGIEKVLINEGVIKTDLAPFNSSKEKVKALLVPVSAHCFYNTCCSIGEWWATLLLCGFVIFMYVHCFGKIRKMSDADAYENDYVRYMMAKKYPELNN